MENLNDLLEAFIQQARRAVPTREDMLLALHCMEPTSLNDTDTTDSIRAFCKGADQGPLGRTASVCVNPEFVKTAFIERPEDVNVATVINFPSGRPVNTPPGGTEAGKTAVDTNAAIKDGANEIDIVLDHASFRQGDSASAEDMLKACRIECSNAKAVMKVILESAVFDRAEALSGACHLALGAGADFLKTSTGKDPAGGASLEAAAVMLNAIRESGSSAGLKVSGGVRTAEDACRYIALARLIMGRDWVKPETFRIGASALLNDLKAKLSSTPVQAAPGTPSPY